jgi:hypothetical protein
MARVDIRRRPAPYLTFGGEVYERWVSWSFKRDTLKKEGEEIRESTGRKYRILPFNKRFVLYVGQKPKSHIKHPLYIVPR